MNRCSRQFAIMLSLSSRNSHFTKIECNGQWLSQLEAIIVGCNCDLILSDGSARIFLPQERYCLLLSIPFHEPLIFANLILIWILTSCKWSEAHGAECFLVHSGRKWKCWNENFLLQLLVMGCVFPSCVSTGLPILICSRQMLRRISSTVEGLQKMRTLPN